MQVNKQRVSMRRSLPAPARRAAEPPSMNQALPFHPRPGTSSHGRQSQRLVGGDGGTADKHSARPGVKQAGRNEAPRGKKGRPAEGEVQSSDGQRPWPQVGLTVAAILSVHSAFKPCQPNSNLATK